MLKKENVLEVVKSKDWELFLEAVRANPDCFLFVYGSLREGEYNYHRIRTSYGDDSLIKVCGGQMDFHNLYSLGEFPAIYRDGAYRDKVIGEIMYCSDDAAAAIRQMEVGAGYKASNETVWIRNPQALDTREVRFFKTYVAGEELWTLMQKYNAPLITGGDWVEFNKEVVKIKR